MAAARIAVDEQVSLDSDGNRFCDFVHEIGPSQFGGAPATISESWRRALAATEHRMGQDFASQEHCRTWLGM
jgi:glutamate-1-semialdehyde aminotransferase